MTDSPLDVLDQILSEAQTKSAQDLEEKQIADEKKIQEDLARQHAADQLHIQQQLAALQGAKQSPQYQAMVEQKQEEVAEKAEQEKNMSGMEITQLGHTTL